MEKLQNNRELWKTIACDMQQLRLSQTPFFTLLPSSSHPPINNNNNNRGPVEKVTGVLLQKYSKMVE